MLRAVGAVDGEAGMNGSGDKIVAKSGIIAICGMGCRFPGARNPGELWDLLVEGRDAVDTSPGGRFPQVDAFLAEAAGSAENAAMAAGGFLEEIDKFDAAAFELSPREAMYLDPQHRLLLETAWGALDDAGQPRQDAKTRNTGVFVGLWASDFENVLYGSGADLEFYAMTGSGRYGASGRLSFTFGFDGPSVSVDAACSSSLVAVHLACQSLLSGECDMALAGGANAILSADSTKMFTKAGMLARDGRCKFGSADADGFVRSEGAGMVVLKRLEDAVAAGDPVHAVVRGGAVSNDGRTSGTLMTPSREGQRQTLRRAWSAAGVSGRDIRLFEAHGTGTSVGDPVEVGAIADALNEAGATERCWIGSIKSNIGHTESAAGIAGLIKTVLALKRRMVPKSRLTGALNTKIDWEASPLRLLTEAVDLSGEELPVIAGVSSFALTGTNAHLVLEEYRPGPVSEEQTEEQAHGTFLVPVSAHTEWALDGLLRGYEAQSVEAGSLRDIAYTASLRRRHDGYRAAIVCESIAELSQSAALARKEAAGVSTGPVKDGKRRVVFVAPGQGSQWAGMARELYAQEPAFRAMLERCDAAVRVETGWSLIEMLTGPGTVEALKEIDVVQPALFSMSVSLAELWRSWGIVPDAVIGHSMGEVAAAFVAGALSLQDAAAVICRRSRLMKTIRRAGAMLTVELPEKAVNDLLRASESALSGGLSIAASNSPETTIVSGDAAAIARLETMLMEREVFCRLIKVDVASHSAQVDPILDKLRDLLREIQPQTCVLPLFSTVLGGYLTGGEMDAEYWAANLRRTVGYAKGIEALERDGYDVFVELGPHPVLLAGTEATLQSGGGDAVAVASTRREKPERREMLDSLGALYRAGCDVAWGEFYKWPARCVALPEYPFQRERCWPELEELKVGSNARQIGISGSHPLLGRRSESAMQPGAVVWEIVANAAALPYLLDHRVHGTVVLPAAAQVELVFGALRAERPESEFVIAAMRFESAMTIQEDGGPTNEFQLGLRRRGDGFDFEIFGRQAGADGEWIRHSSGSAELRKNVAKVERVDLSVATRAGMMHLDKRSHYRIRTRAGIGYGPAFQLVEEAWCGSGESLLRTGQVAGGSRRAGKYLVHPALLDSCFQALQLAQPDGEGFLYDDTSLPVSIGRMEIFGELPATGDLFCRARVTSADAGEGKLRGDLTLADQDGEVLGVVLGFEVRRVSAGVEERAGELLTEIAWEPYELPGMKAGSNVGRSELVVIFCDTGGIGEALAGQIESAGARVVLVRQGTQFGVRKGVRGREYGASVDRADEVRRVFADLVTHGERPGDVVYLWALSDTQSNGGGADALLAAQKAGAYFLPSLVQAISACDWSAPPRLWMVTGGGVALGDGPSMPMLAVATIWGVGKVAAVEHPELRASLVDLSFKSDSDEIDVLAGLIASGTDEERIAVRGREIYVERFVRAEGGLKLERTMLFRKDRTYLITGGMGGVGATVAEWMAANGAGCLVLVSRRAESDETRGILGRIEKLGARAVHAQTDICDRAAVGRLMATVRREMPPIAGVMQAATVIDDALLTELSPSRFNAVMGPKVKGTWNLYDATAEDGLEFMVLFSSIASVYPQPGHGSYAAANAFMDSFAHWARASGRKVTSINWGGWEQIGLARETGTARSIAGYGDQGFGTMSGGRALSALRRAIETDVVQAVAGPIDLEQAAEFFGDGRVPPVLRRLLVNVSRAGRGGAETHVGAKLSESKSRAEDLAILERYLIEELGRVLKLSPERISTETLFGSVGLDSLMTLEFVRRLKTGLGLAVPIPTTAVFNHPTAASLASEIARRMQLHPETKRVVEEEQATVNARAMTTALVADEMSDDEALQALLQPMGER